MEVRAVSRIQKTLHTHIYIYLFNLLCVISSIHKPAEQFTFML